jgi:hypothetical protein
MSEGELDVDVDHRARETAVADRRDERPVRLCKAQPPDCGAWVGPRPTYPAHDTQVVP